jgi:DNA-3-methyladenine glycosylase II
MWKKAEKTLKEDKYISPLILAYGVCRISPSSKDKYFEDLFESIVSQQLSIKAASTIFERARVGLGGEVTPEKILATKDNKFRKWGLSGQKTKYVKDLAEKASGEEVKINSFSTLPDDEIVEELTKVKGIGVWTSHMFLMFSLARPDIFPVLDLGIRNGMTKLLKKDLDPEKMVSFAERWSPFRTVASWYIWRSLENG